MRRQPAGIPVSRGRDQAIQRKQHQREEAGVEELQMRDLTIVQS